MTTATAAPIATSPTVSTPVKATIRLSEAGRKDAIRRKLPGGEHLTILIQPDQPEYEDALALATVASDGEAIIDSRPAYLDGHWTIGTVAMVGPTMYDAVPTVAQFLADETARRTDFLSRCEAAQAAAAAKLRQEIAAAIAGGVDGLLLDQCGQWRVKYICEEKEAPAELRSIQLSAQALADQRNADRKALEKREEAAKKTAKAEAERLAKQEQAEWISAHGSERLKRCLAEGIDCGRAYRDERLAMERPDWRWSDAVECDGHDPINPPLEAFVLLDEARKLEPDAELRYLTVDHEHDEDGFCDQTIDGNDCPKYDWTGYGAIATFLGRDILYGGPTDGPRY